MQMSTAVVELACAERVVPPVPENIQDTGLPGAMIEQLLLKMLYFRGEVMGRDLALAAGLKFSVIEETMEVLKRQHMVAVKRSMGIGNKSAILRWPTPDATSRASIWTRINTQVLLLCRCISMRRSSGANVSRIVG